jgi:DNA-binding Lrp family transcriptional regulator
MPELDSTDSSIINRIQSDFPITPRPFLTVANELGISENEVLDRVKRLKAEGIIRRIGGNFVPGNLGFVSTLCPRPWKKSKKI